MRFKLTISAVFDADSGYDALIVRRNAHSAFEDALVDRSLGDPQPDPEMELFNLLRDKLEGLDEASQEALRQALLETEGST